MRHHIKILLTAALVSLLGICAALSLWLITGMRERERYGTWPFQAGEYAYFHGDLGISVLPASCEAEIPVQRLRPNEIKEKGFHFYKGELQNRLGAALIALAEERAYTMEEPLAVMNPFGTADTGLLLHFYTEQAVEVRYTIHVEKEGISDFAAVAKNPYKTYSRKHVFQVIGLVPGETNQVCLEAVDPFGRVREKREFTISMPAPTSGYPTKLDYEEGESGEALADGLYALLRTAGFSNYAFFYDNDGIMRYEMRFERQGPVNILWYEGDMLVNTSPYKIVRISPVGQVTCIYDMGGLKLHHDMTVIREDCLLVLASDEKQIDLEDLIVEINLETGEYHILMDFKQILPQYHSMTNIARGDNKTVRTRNKRDWLHFNSIYYEEETDSVILSAREPSTIMKIRDIHREQKVEYFIGDPSFWEDTAYAEYCYQPKGEFLYQYGQHSVEFAGWEDQKEGRYYLRMFNNNFWNLGTRNGYEPKLPGGVGREIEGEPYPSWIYTYLVDENAKTFELVDAFEVPYSGLSSNVHMAGENYVANSATSRIFAEYDQEGKAIRIFPYKTKTQAYRVYKETGEGYWFEKSDFGKSRRK